MLRRLLEPLIPTLRQVAAALFILLASGGSQAALFARTADNLQREAEAAHADGKQLAIVLTLPDCPGCLEMERTVYRDRRTEKLIAGRFRTVRHRPLARHANHRRDGTYHDGREFRETPARRCHAVLPLLCR
jgi:thioredoxin-related protein